MESLTDLKKLKPYLCRPVIKTETHIGVERATLAQIVSINKLSYTFFDVIADDVSFKRYCDAGSYVTAIASVWAALPRSDAGIISSLCCPGKDKCLIAKASDAWHASKQCVLLEKCHVLVLGGSYDEAIKKLLNWCYDTKAVQDAFLFREH